MLVKVRNKNSYPFKCNWRGENYDILPGQAVSMEHDKAVEFIGTMHFGIKTLANGLPDPMFLQDLGIEYPEKAKPVDAGSAFHCNSCKYVGSSREALDEHIDENHLDLIEDKDVASARRGRPKGSKNVQKSSGAAA